MMRLYKNIIFVTVILVNLALFFLITMTVKTTTITPSTTTTTTITTTTITVSTFVPEKRHENVICIPDKKKNHRHGKYHYKKEKRHNIFHKHRKCHKHKKCVKTVYCTPTIIHKCPKVHTKTLTVTKTFTSTSVLVSTTTATATTTTTTAVSCCAPGAFQTTVPIQLHRLPPGFIKQSNASDPISCFGQTTCDKPVVSYAPEVIAGGIMRCQQDGCLSSS
ncbi:hypothetical protein GLOIN_2v1630307 [Rhizophagus clarus]|uniref:Uncharacterized protein n=1 Tax=Rhizophagus clarus TaxID=94130 RepID=A0A8H3QTT7_9GLOM|nr:hypothetical protein GLOIN_2v1630307 [Rhizophagus clarus]